MRFKQSMDNLTDVGAISRSSLRATHPGMMYFADTGPVGTTCGDCLHWTAIAQGGSKMRCQLYAEATRDSRKQVPGGAPSCKYFEARPPVNTANIPLRPGGPMR